MPFPLTPPPANDLGAITWPRRLQRWLDDNPVGALTRTSTYFNLPIFNAVGSWNGYSDIVASFNFESTNSFCIKSFVAPINPNYACTIAYAVNTTTIVRYLLWNATGANIPAIYIPYTNQTILKNFRLEIWNTSQGASSEAKGAQFYTSKMGPFDYRYGTDGSLVTADSENTNFADNAVTFSVPPSFTANEWWKPSGIVNIGSTYVSWNQAAGTGGITEVVSVPTVNNTSSPLSLNCLSSVVKFNLNSTSEVVPNFYIVVNIGASDNGSLTFTTNGGTQVLAVYVQASGGLGKISLFGTGSSAILTVPLNQPIAIQGQMATGVGSVTVYNQLGQVLGNLTCALTLANLSYITVGVLSSVYEIMTTTTAVSQSVYANYIGYSYGYTYFTMPLNFPSGSYSQTN